MKTSLTTVRLVLRSFSALDFAALRALTRQPEITDILPDWAMSDKELVAYLAAWESLYLRFNPQNPEWLFAMTLAEGGELIGWVGIWPKDGLDSAFPEVAYAISRDYRGLGLVSEAVQAATAELFACSPLPAIVGIVKDWTQPSYRVLDHAGFLPRGKVTVSGEGEFDLRVLSRPGLAQSAPVVLRAATVADAPALAAVQKMAYLDNARRWGPWSSDSASAGPGGYDVPGHVAYMIQMSHYYVIELAGVMVGGTGCQGPIAGKVFVEYLHIDPAFGRQGLAGKALLLLEELIPAGNIWLLATSAHSLDNQRFYQKCGYRIVGSEPDAVYFERQLRPNAPGAEHHLQQKLDYNSWSDCAMADAIFYNCNLENSRFIDVNMVGVKLHNANLSGLSIGDARLARLKISNASWGGAHLQDLARGWHPDDEVVVMERCDLAGAQITDCDLRQAQITSQQLDGLMINGIAYSDLLQAWQQRKG